MKRLFSATKGLCQICPKSNAHQIIGANPCQYIITPAPRELSYFTYFCLRPIYRIDKLLLTDTYKQYQKVLHPDKFARESLLVEGATTASAYTSNAYKTLMNDIDRAQYLLKTEYGVDSFDESVREQNPELANWVFETRMEIEEADSLDELMAIQMSVQTQYDDKIEKIASIFESGELLKVKEELESTQYLIRMLAQLDIKIDK